MRKFIIIYFCLGLVGCTTFKDKVTILLYTVEKKELVFAKSPCANTQRDKPYLVSAWIKEKDIDNIVIVCDDECNCRITKKTSNTKLVQLPSDNGICK